MANDKRNLITGPRNTLSSEEAEALFATVDETGHSNESKARREHRRRRARKASVDVDPLSGEDPSGSSVGRTITRAAVGFVTVFLAIVVIGQVSCGLARRAGTTRLTENVNVRAVASALRGGVEWGNGFTQFPEDFSVQEADEDTGRIEVTVVDTSSENEMECLSGSQIQAGALAVNALMNPNINQVIYHVNVHIDDEGNFQQSTLFGFLKPTGQIKQFATFVWTKTANAQGGVDFTCSIIGLDAETADNLREKLAVPTNIFEQMGIGVPATTSAAQTDDAASGESDTGKQATPEDIAAESGEAPVTSPAEQ